MDPRTITEQLLFSTVRLEAQKSQRTEAATAFLFSYKETKGRNFIFLVTNKHVIAGAHTGRCFFTQRKDGKPWIGKRFDIEIPDLAAQWHGHPVDEVDVAVMPVVPVLSAIKQAGKSVFFRTIPHTLIPTDEKLRDLDPLEEVIFVGYPSGLFDSKNLMPILRRGTTATPPQLDYEGRPTFLVDASVFPGSSGSPVLICNRGIYATRTGTTVGNRVMLLGVIARVLIREEEGHIEIVAEPSAMKPVIKSQQMIDLGIVYKARTVLETVKGAVEKLTTG